jgi:hypothetical protein
MPHYVILEHDHPYLHWDFMLEAGEVLRAWRLAEPPEPGKTVAARLIGDHRLMYLDYEGPVSGNRGQVRRWDSGNYEGETPSTEKADGSIAFVLHGRRLRGQGTLTCSAEGTWSFCLAPGTQSSVPSSD